MGDQTITIYHAAAVVRSNGDTFRPGALASGEGGPVWIGPADELPVDLARGRRRVDLSNALLLPGMVNAHGHLELTDVGPRPYPGNFIGWMVALREQWLGQSLGSIDRPDPLVESAERGARASLASGVQAIGDISRLDQVAQARRAVGLGGVTYQELFGVGPPWDEPGLHAIACQPNETKAEGVQPHAPYSAGPSLYQAASRSGRPVCTHLAEMPEELRFLSRADGPWLKFLKGIGKWDEAFAPFYDQGLSPVGWMRPYLEQAAERGKPWLLAHCNYVTDEDIRVLAQTGTSVAYCPRASRYFGHPHTDAVPEAYLPAAGQSHRYQDMLEAGINVCLGTDSIVCQPPDEPQPMGILAQMRMLYRRDRTDPRTLLRMATFNGADALATQRAEVVSPGFFTVAIDPSNSTDPLIQALTNDEPIKPMDGNVWSS